jgi:hypothetical protein
MESFIVWGNVFIRARDSLVNGPRASGEQGRRKVESDTFVQMRLKRDVLEGKGLDA